MTKVVRWAKNNLQIGVSETLLWMFLNVGGCQLEKILIMTKTKISPASKTLFLTKVLKIKIITLSIFWLSDHFVVKILFSLNDGSSTAVPFCIFIEGHPLTYEKNGGSSLYLHLF